MHRLYRTTAGVLLAFLRPGFLLALLCFVPQLAAIAHAPNPAGQSILGRHFPDGIAPLYLLLGALLPTVVAALAFRLL